VMCAKQTKFQAKRLQPSSGFSSLMGLAASDYGALMVVFRSPEERDSTLRLFPFSLDGHL
jgi:hypothetical protein